MVITMLPNKTKFDNFLKNQPIGSITNTSVHVQVFTVTSILFTHNCVLHLYYSIAM